MIECCKPIRFMCLSSRFIILGEENGVRAFSLRNLVREKVKRVKNIQGSGFPNGVIGDGTFGGSSQEIGCNGRVEGRIDQSIVFLLSL